MPNSTKDLDEDKKFSDCADLYQAGFHKNAVYTIQINSQETKKVRSHNFSLLSAVTWTYIITSNKRFYSAVFHRFSVGWRGSQLSPESPQDWWVWMTGASCCTNIQSWKYTRQLWQCRSVAGGFKRDTELIGRGVIGACVFTSTSRSPTHNWWRFKLRFTLLCCFLSLKHRDDATGPVREKELKYELTAVLFPFYWKINKNSCHGSTNTFCSSRTVCMSLCMYVWALSCILQTMN